MSKHLAAAESHLRDVIQSLEQEHMALMAMIATHGDGWNRWSPFSDDELGMLLEGLDELREEFHTAETLDDELKAELERRRK